MRTTLGMALALGIAAASGAWAEAPAAPTAAPTRHFGFTKLVVADLDRSAAFYENAIGLVRQRRIDFDGAAGTGSEILYEPTAPGGAMFVLIHYATKTQPSTGETVLGFYTDDIDALVARIREAGGAIDTPPYAIPEMKLRVAFARDPEGHVLELLQQTE